MLARAECTGAKASIFKRRQNPSLPRESSPEPGPLPGQDPPSTQGPAPSSEQGPPQLDVTGELMEEDAQKSLEPSPVGAAVPVFWGACRAGGLFGASVLVCWDRAAIRREMKTAG
eukprot:1158240-Pelagomonas_calceolata.AAC.1